MKNPQSIGSMFRPTRFRQTFPNPMARSNGIPPREWVNRGISRVKIKVGREPAQDLPRVEAEPTGFSCREQIAQTTERRAVHLAEVIRMVF
jgi:hypothetical protein